MFTNGWHRTLMRGEPSGRSDNLQLEAFRVSTSCFPLHSQGIHMNRRNAIKGLVASLAAFQEFVPRVGNALPPSVGKLFPTDLPPLKPAQFPAEGFRQPACGVIYQQTQPPRGGMALGGIDTGFLTLEPDGTFGSCTIFNSISPMRPPLALPFLGMSLKSRDEVWLLGSPRSAFGGYVWIPIRHIQTPPVVHYWGHYPVADLEYTMPDSPVSVGMRAWSPFLPGDSATSNTPGAVFEVHLRNVSGTSRREGSPSCFRARRKPRPRFACTVRAREERSRTSIWLRSPPPHAGFAAASPRRRVFRPGGDLRSGQGDRIRNRGGRRYGGASPVAA